MQFRKKNEFIPHFLLRLYMMYQLTSRVQIHIHFEIIHMLNVMSCIHPKTMAGILLRTICLYVGANEMMENQHNGISVLRTHGNKSKYVGVNSYLHSNSKSGG